MRDILRLITTLIIWGAFISVMGVTLASATGPVTRMNGGEIITLMAIFMTGAVAATYAVWHGGFQRGQLSDYNRQDYSPGRAAKLKRAQSDRVERLIDDLDDNEIYELESLLLAREQEAERARNRS